MKNYHWLMILPALAMGACGNQVKKTLGMERNMPDEFAVVERAPLTMPPNFSLAPPQPGKPRQADTQNDIARGLVLGSEISAPRSGQKAAISRAENVLLSKTGATQVDPNIRKEMAEAPVDEPKTVAQKLGVASPGSEGKALNPVEEAKRLQEEKIKTVPVKAAPAKNAK